MRFMRDCVRSCIWLRTGLHSRIYTFVCLWWTSGTFNQSNKPSSTTVPDHVTTAEVSELDQLCWNSNTYYSHMVPNLWGKSVVKHKTALSRWESWDCVWSLDSAAKVYKLDRLWWISITPILPGRLARIQSSAIFGLLISGKFIYNLANICVNGHTRARHTSLPLCMDIYSLYGVGGGRSRLIGDH